MNLYRVALSTLMALFTACTVTHADDAAAATTPSTHATNARAVKVMIITLFGPEADAWLQRLPFDQSVAVPGLSNQFPAIRCTKDDICMMTTGMGHTNAAASTMAMALSQEFDLSHTYFIITGIAGIDPNVGTIGSAAWARYLVDFGLAHEIDAREKPTKWSSGYFGIGAKDANSKPTLEYGTEIFHLDEAFVQRAVALSQQATLADNDTAKAYRQRYPQATAHGEPKVLQCDTSAGDTYWHGEKLGKWSTKWTALLTDGKGTYCTTQQEDNAVYEALKRASAAGRVDIKRVADLRTAANFDRPHPGQSAYDSLNAQSGGFPAATANLYYAGWPVIKEIVMHWSSWKDGVPAQ